MGNELDCRGLACPAPVLETRELIEKENPLLVNVIVDNEAAKQNVSRFLRYQNYEVTTTQQGDLYRLTGKRGTDTFFESSPVENSNFNKKRIMVMVAADKMGRGDDELGVKLMVNFLKTLKEMGNELWRLIFVNNGVKLTVQDSEVLPILVELEKGGVDIFVCGTCLNHFGLLDDQRVGETTNMLDIVTAMQLADKVINT
jgi:selenium metabolism protein YedF